MSIAQGSNQASTVKGSQGNWKEGTTVATTFHHMFFIIISWQTIDRPFTSKEIAACATQKYKWSIVSGWKEKAEVKNMAASAAWLSSLYPPDVWCPSGF